MAGVLDGVTVAERVRAAQQLHEARDHLRAVTDSMGEALCTLDDAGHVHYMNAAAEHLLGYGIDELRGRTLHDATHYRHPDGSPYPIQDCPLYAAHRAREPTRVEDDMFIRRDGTDVPVSWVLTPFDSAEGNHSVIVFTDNTRAKAQQEKLQLEIDELSDVRDLHEALQEQRFELFAQPIIDLTTGATVSHELLLRMRERDGAIRVPGSFLTIAERCGLIRELDRWVIGQSARLSGEGHRVELNLSAASLSDPCLFDDFVDAIARHGADPALMVIELTETALMQDEASARSFIERVRVLGCEFALDDFGTGFGGFSYLKRLPVDYLKIDVEFVRDVCTDSASRKVVQAVVGLAKAFGQRTVAEGVEDDMTLRMIREMGVDYAQGYGIGLPAPLDDTLYAAGSQSLEQSRSKRVLDSHRTRRASRDQAGPQTDSGPLLDLAATMTSELAQQRTRLLDAQSIAKLGSWEWDIASDTINWSAELCRIYGLAPDAHPKDFEAALGCLHHEDRSRVEAQIRAAYESGEPFALKARIVRPDGSVRVLQSLGEVIVGDDGQPGRLLGTGQDITERESMEAQLRSSSRYFDLSRDVIAAAGFDGHFKRVNPAVQLILGWTPEEFMAQRFIDLVHPDDRAATLAEVDKLAAGAVTLSFVNRYLAKGGGYRWLDWNAIVAPGEPLMYCSGRDITERKEAESALATSERQTRQIIETAHDAFVAIDAQGLITDWNPTAQDTFGWSRHEALGRELAQMIIPERYRDAHHSGLERFRAGGEARVVGKLLELSAMHRDGREFPIEMTISATETPDGHTFNAFLRDITARRDAEHETERSRRLLERLLRAQHAITRVFAEAQSSDEALRALLAALGEAMEWQLGAWWAREDGEEVLHCRSVWRRDDSASEFEKISLSLELPRGLALPGRAWASGEAEWTADLAADPSFPRSKAAADDGLHASLCVPIFAEHEFRGAVEFFGSHIGEPDHATRQILGTIADQIGGFMAVLDERTDLLGKLQRLALTDELTGLDNRRAWQEALERETARARRHGEPLCVAMLDLDHFKRFNDTHGHQAGDRLLAEMAHEWRAQVRAGDILARYGGEEFSLVLPRSSLEVAESVLARVRAATPQAQTCSAGVVAFDGIESVEHLVGRADAALYAAKAQGRDRTVTA
ncbi:MAG TPA: EAL domain-containing protein [Solirubrobacteraceae bacterium]|nr:EAL domain-containing protein [Solirubrobacteraceae bacterium]